MSLDVYLNAVRRVTIFSANITHNLGSMAKEAGIYEVLWHPEEIGVTTAAQVAKLLRPGLELMKSDPARFREFNADNGWGLYEDFIPWLEKYLAACEENPDAEVSASA